MTLGQFEARKMFKRNRGAVIIALFLIAELALLILGDAPVNTDAALYRERYLVWLDKVEGPWTREKAGFLESEAQSASALDDEGFNALYQQYLYVNEGRENRYFLDANGWAGLLAERAPDIPLMAAILLLCVPVYCGETVSGMEPLALTSREGKRLFLRYKLLLALTVAAALSLSSDLVRLAFFALKYGLPHGSYPMQSVELFGSATKNLSLRGAEALAVGLRLLGSAELAAMTLLFSALCGQFALPAFLGTAVAVLPWIGLDKSLQYALPLPSPLLLAVGFMRGSEYGTDAVTGESVALFREVSWEKLALTAGSAAAISVICVILIRGHYKTALSGGRKSHFKLAALMIALCLFLGGCAREAQSPGGDILYNSRDARTYAYNDLTVSAINRELVATDSAGASAPLIRDALKGVNGAVYNTNFYAGGKYVYLWKADSEGYGQKLASDTGKTYIFSLVRVDLDTFTSEVVFENVIQHTVLGIDVPVNESLSFLGSDVHFFVDDKYIYLLSHGVRRVELKTGKLDQLGIPSNRNVAYDGRNIYFVGDGELIFRFDTETEETAALFDEPVRDFRLTAEGLAVTTEAGESVTIT